MRHPNHTVIVAMEVGDADDYGAHQIITSTGPDGRTLTRVAVSYHRFWRLRSALRFRRAMRQAKRRNERMSVAFRPFGAPTHIRVGRLAVPQEVATS